MAEQRPTGLETKSTIGARLGYIPAVVPTENRTGPELTDDERRRADDHGNLQVGGSGLPEADAENSGLATDSGGVQTTHTATTNRRERSKKE